MSDEPVQVYTKRGTNPPAWDEGADLGIGDGTASFIGTVVGDTSGDQFDLVFVQDPNHDAVDWASVVAGQIVLTGPIAIDMLYRYVARLDFTDAAGFSTANTSPDTDATVQFSRIPGDGFQGNAGGPYAAIPVGTPGVIFDIDAAEQGLTQGTRCAANVELAIKGRVNGQGFDDAGAPVTDGVLTAALAITIIRTSIPSAPALP